MLVGIYYFVKNLYQHKIRKNQGNGYRPEPSLYCKLIYSL